MNNDITTANIWSSYEGSSYRQACALAVTSNAHFTWFKSNPDYARVLEHLPDDHAHKYLLTAAQLLSGDFFRCLTASCLNDSIGDGRKTTWRNWRIGTTTARYLWVVADVRSKIGKPKSIVEIGGGYGGQRLLFSLLDNVGDYTIFDLMEPLALTKKYLYAHGIAADLRLPDNIPVSPLSTDLMLSSYALSELPDDSIAQYVTGIQANHGHLICNDRQRSVERICRHKYGDSIRISSEPCSDTNYVVWW